MEKIIHKKDFGNIEFGIYAGNRWIDLPMTYLEYLTTEECHISARNKKIAKDVLKDKRDIEGQTLMF